uniref:N/A n=1 Tax=Ganoderma boninense TaxID=34458 RepID=A0A5K1K627_9APHY|nr:N/A [Ganoderma boninense]
MYSNAAHFGSHSTAVCSAAIHDLPAEVLFLIFWSYLYGQDIARCMRVCRYFANLINSDVYLQYRIELAKNGMIDGPSGTLPVSERLERLRQYSSNFRNGIFNHEDITAHPDYLQQFLKIQSRGRSRTETAGGVTSVLHISDSDSRKYFLAVFVDPSEQAGIIDRAQDLFVTFEQCFDTGTNTWPFQLRLFSWSGLQVCQTDHPAAAAPRVQIWPLSAYPGNLPAQIQIHSTVIGGCYVVWNVFAMKDHVPSHSIHACNWRTGQMVSRIDLGATHHNFVLLDDTYILALPAESDPDSDSEPPLLVFSLAPPSQSPATTRPLCCLQLPAVSLNPGERVVDREMRTSRHPPTPNGHFHDDPSVSMVVLTYDLAMDGSAWPARSRTSYLLIPCAALLAHLRLVSVVGASPDPDPPAPVPWEAWGPLMSLRLWAAVHPHADHFPGSIALVPYGSRMPVVVFEGPDCTRASVCVFETNPLVVRHARAIARSNSDLNSEAGSGGILESRTRATVGSAIVEDVEAALPGVVDPECSAIPFVVYRFGIPLDMEEEQHASRMIQAVRMSMTGFTVTVSSRDSATRPLRCAQRGIN